MPSRSSSVAGVRAALRALLLTGSAFLAACGGSDGGDGGSTAAAASGTISIVAGTVGPGIATDAAGNLFYSVGPAVLKRSPAGEVAAITTKNFVVPLGLAADGAGNLFVTERSEEQFGPSYFVNVWRIDKQGQAVFAPGSLSLTSRWPPGIAAAPDGSYYVSAGGILRRVMPDGAMSNVTAPEVRRTIDSLAVDARGNVYFGHDNTIRKIVPGQAEVLLAGSSDAGFVDGPGARARFHFGGNKNILDPLFETSLAVDSIGNVYVSDNGNHTVRKISPAGVVTTIAGQPGVPGLETGALPGKLNATKGLALQGDKTLFVSSGGTLLRIELPSS